MYSVNGIDLPSSQYKELRDLVNLESDDERIAFSNKALHSYDNKDLWNPNGVACYKALYEKGLIDGTPVMNGFLFDGVVTQAGIDFINDSQEMKKQAKKLSRHDYLVAIVGAIASFIAGMLVEAFSGIASSVIGMLL